GERDHLAQRGQIAAHLLHHLGHRASAISGDQEYAVGLRLAQYVAQFLWPQGGLTVTMVIPARPAASSRITHSGMLLAHTATRSPGANRPSSARAARSEASSSSA